MFLDIIKVAIGHGPRDQYQPKPTSSARKLLRLLEARSKSAARDLRHLPSAVGTSHSSRSVSVDQLTVDMFELRGLPDKNGKPGPLAAHRPSTPDPALRSRHRSRTWQSNPHLGPQFPDLVKRSTAPAVMGPPKMPLCWYLKGKLSEGTDSSGTRVQLKAGKRAAKPIPLRRQFAGGHGNHYFMLTNADAFMRELDNVGNVLYVDTGIVAKLAPRQATRGQSRAAAQAQK